MPDLQCFDWTRITNNGEFLKPVFDNFKQNDEKLAPLLKKFFVATFEYLKKQNNSSVNIDAVYYSVIKYRSVIKNLSKNSIANSNTLFVENVVDSIASDSFSEKSKFKIALYNKHLTSDNEQKNHEYYSNFGLIAKHVSNQSNYYLADVILSNPVLFKNQNIIQNAMEIFDTADNENADIKDDIMGMYANSPVLYNNEDLSSHIGSILSGYENGTLSTISNLMAKYLSNPNLQKSPVADYIGHILNKTDKMHRTVLNTVFETENLYNNEDFVKRLDTVLDSLEKQSECNNALAVLNLYLSTPQLFNNKNMQNKLWFLLFNLSRDELAPNLYKLLVLYSSDSKYYDDEFISKKITNIACSLTEHNYNAISELTDRAASGKDSQLTDNFDEYLELIKSGYFNSIDDINLYEKFLKKTSGTESLANLHWFMKNNTASVSAGLNLLGERSFDYLMKTYLNGFQKFIQNLGNSLYGYIGSEEIEALIQKTNYKVSKKYKILVDSISNEKKHYTELISEGNSEELNVVKNKINSLTRELRTMADNSIKDPVEKYNYLNTFMSLLEKYSVEEVLKMMNNKASWHNDMEKAAFKLAGELYDENISKKMNLDKSKYMGGLICANAAFYLNFARLIQLLKDNPNKSFSEIFNDLPQNVATKRIFEENGINYDRWVTVDKKSFLTSNDFTARQVDMNDIGYSLFLGNQVSCCTKVNLSGTWQVTAPLYIKNKLISAIEILHNGESIGNTMCYFALVDNKPALILDNVELKNPYHEDQEIEKLIINYAKKLCKEVGKPNIPIYTGSFRQKIDINKYTRRNHDFKILGSTNGDKIYFDFISDSKSVGEDNPEKVFLYRLDKGKNTDNDLSIIMDDNYTTRIMNYVNDNDFYYIDEP